MPTIPAKRWPVPGWIGTWTRNGTSTDPPAGTTTRVRDSSIHRPTPRGGRSPYASPPVAAVVTSTGRSRTVRWVRAVLITRTVPRACPRGAERKMKYGDRPLSVASENGSVSTACALGAPSARATPAARTTCRGRMATAPS